MEYDDIKKELGKYNYSHEAKAIIKALMGLNYTCTTVGVGMIELNKLNGYTLYSVFANGAVHFSLLDKDWDKN